MSGLYDPDRVTPEGRALGEQLARLVEPVVQLLAAEGEPDERCATCAFRAGTVPNGCPQTLMDAMKCVVEGSRVFLCHMDLKREKACHGYYAARVAAHDVPDFEVPWDYSPDETP